MPDQVTAIEGTTGILQPQRGTNPVWEDIFPPLDISDVEKTLKDWFDNDLKRCVDHVSSYIPNWDKWREIYSMSQISQMYPEISRANFSSGLLCEKMIELMDRLKRGIYISTPLFTVDMESSDVTDIDFVIVWKISWMIFSLMFLKCRELWGTKRFLNLDWMVL